MRIIRYFERGNLVSKGSIWKLWLAFLLENAILKAYYKFRKYAKNQ